MDRKLNPLITPETDEYGISSFVFRSNKPFDPQRFWDYIQSKFPTTIIRSKGFFPFLDLVKQFHGISFFIRLHCLYK